VSDRTQLVIIFEITDDLPDGQPTLPVEEGFWCAIHHARGRTTWRRVGLHTGELSEDAYWPEGDP